MSVSEKNSSKLGRPSESGPSMRTQQLEEDSQANLMTQSELFKAYSEQNHLYLNMTNSMLWFEFGGSKIGKLHVDGGEAQEYSSWRLVAKYKGEFACHFTTVFVNGGAQGCRPLTEDVNKNVGSWFLLGGVGNNCLQYIDRNVLHKAPMPTEISFFPAVSINAQFIYTFGGYDNVEKMQVKSCDVYDINKDRWHKNEVQLNVARSQSSACQFRENVVFIFGGYSKEAGTLDSIERYDIDRRRITLIELRMPSALRRFASIKISKTKVLLLGGISRLSKDSDAVYCFDCEE